MLNTLDSIGVKPASDLSTDEILDKIQAYLRSKRSVLADRFAYLDYHQHSHEPIDNFLVRLDTLLKSVHLCHEHETRDDCVEFTHVEE